MRPKGPARSFCVSMAAFLIAGLPLGGCSMLGGGEKPEAAVASARSGAAGGEIDVRRYIGPNYCPELRIVRGMELARNYEAGHDDDANHVIWQASIGKTARECLYDTQGGLTLRIGVSGRVISGPKGGAGTVAVPLKIAIVKYQEAVLFSQVYDLAAIIPAHGSAVFTEVKEVFVPSPGTDRDYLIYIGFNTIDWDPMKPMEAAAPAAAPADAEEEFVPLPEEAAPEPPPPPQESQTPNELPTPKGLIPGL